MFVGRNQRTGTSDAAELVKASQAGERGAFDELVRLYQRRAMQVATRVLGNANDAAEAVQAGFVRAYLNIDKLREPKRFEIWLLRIVTNAAISQARAAKRRLQQIRIADCAGSKKTFSPVDRHGTEELKEAIQRAMLRLSKKEAKAMSLFGLQNLSHGEVAEIMGCSVEAVRWLNEKISVNMQNVKLKQALRNVVTTVDGTVDIDAARNKIQVQGPRHTRQSTAPKASKSGDYVGKISIPMDGGKYFIEFMLREEDLTEELRKLWKEKMTAILKGPEVLEIDPATGNSEPLKKPEK